MHEDCLLKQATEKAWAKLNGQKSEPPTDTIEVDGSNQLEDTIQVNPKVQESLETTSLDEVLKPNSVKGKLRRKSKTRKTEIGEPGWKDQLTAELEIKPSIADNEENAEITGNVILTDISKEVQPRKWKEPLTCLFCQRLLT